MDFFVVREKLLKKTFVKDDWLRKWWKATIIKEEIYCNLVNGGREDGN